MHQKNTQQGLLLEYITLGWNVVACVGVGSDSVIEIVASIVVVWQLKSINKDKERFAERLIGVSFLLLALYIAVQSAVVLGTHFHSGASPLGMVWLALTAVAMFALAYGKGMIGEALNNPVLKKESKVTMVDGLLATTMLIGIFLNYHFGLWWADPVTALVIVYYGIQEGLEALHA